MSCQKKAWFGWCQQSLLLVWQWQRHYDMFFTWRGSHGNSTTYNRPSCGSNVHTILANFLPSQICYRSHKQPPGEDRPLHIERLLLPQGPSCLPSACSAGWGPCLHCRDPSGLLLQAGDLSFLGWVCSQHHALISSVVLGLLSLCSQNSAVTTDTGIHTPSEGWSGVHPSASSCRSLQIQSNPDRPRALQPSCVCSCRWHTEITIFHVQNN